MNTSVKTAIMTLWVYVIFLVYVNGTTTGLVIYPYIPYLEINSTHVYDCTSEGNGNDPALQWVLKRTDNSTGVTTVVLNNSELYSELYDGMTPWTDGMLTSRVNLFILESYVCTSCNTTYTLFCEAYDEGSSSATLFNFTSITGTRVHGIATDVRLSHPVDYPGLFKPNEGAVEVLINDNWGPIFSHGVDEITAKTICKILGYGFTGFLVEKFYFIGDPYLYKLDCGGYETSISECTQEAFKAFSKQIQAPGIHCFAQDVEELRLIGGERPNSGQVLVKMDGRWGVMCGEYTYIHIPVIEFIICRTLGYQRGLEQVSAFDGFNWFDKDISWLSINNIDCIGNETHLNQCNIKEGRYIQPTCFSASYFSVNCYTELGEHCTSDIICTAVTDAICIDNKCECKYGYTDNGTYACTECDDFHYGRNCSHVCDCELNNVRFTVTSRSCDDITGSCACKPNWTGSRCDTDQASSGELITIMLSSITGCIVLAVIITVCVCKYRKRDISKGANAPTPNERNDILEPGRKGHRELAPAMTSADREEYNTIDDSKLGVVINAAVEYDLHPDLLERTDAKTDEENRYDSGGYLKPAHINTNTSYAYAYADKRLETDEHGYLKMENERRQLPEVPTDKQIELQHPYEGLKGSRQGEHDYSELNGTQL